jgi:predicted ATPase
MDITATPLASIGIDFEDGFPTVAETEPETLAQHLTEAGLAERAVGYWLRAGRNAAARSANLEAITVASAASGLPVVA